MEIVLWPQSSDAATCLFVVCLICPSLNYSVRCHYITSGLVPCLRPTASGPLAASQPFWSFISGMSLLPCVLCRRRVRYGTLCLTLPRIFWWSCLLLMYTAAWQPTLHWNIRGFEWVLCTVVFSFKGKGTPIIFSNTGVGSDLQFLRHTAHRWC